jgi:hypothetical protein
LAASLGEEAAAQIESLWSQIAGDSPEGMTGWCEWAGFNTAIM